MTVFAELIISLLIRQLTRLPARLTERLKQSKSQSKTAKQNNYFVKNDLPGKRPGSNLGSKIVPGKSEKTQRFVQHEAEPAQWTLLNSVL